MEARDRVGGRVHSHTGPFGAPVDLGASLITGTAPDMEGGRAPDPCTFLCRQLGVALHPLGEELRLFDGRGGGEVERSLDEAVER